MLLRENVAVVLQGSEVVESSRKAFRTKFKFSVVLCRERVQLSGERGGAGRGRACLACSLDLVWREPIESRTGLISEWFVTRERVVCDMMM